MEVQGCKENFIPWTHIHLICGLKGTGVYPGENFYSRGATASSGALCGLGDGTGGASLPFFRPLAPLPRIPSTSGLSPYIQELLPTSFPMVGMPMKYNFDPITGQPLKASILSTFSLPSQPLGASFLTPTSPCVRSVDLARTEPGGASTSGWVPILLIPSGSGQENTHCDCVLCPCQDNSVSIA